MSSVLKYMTSRETGPETPVRFRDLLAVLGQITGAVINGTVAAGDSFTTLFSSSFSAAESARSLTAAIPFRASALTVVLTGTQPNDGAVNILVRKNGVDTALAITIPAGAIGPITYTDTLPAHAVDFAAGDVYALHAQNLSASASGTILSFTVGLQ